MKVGESDPCVIQSVVNTGDDVEGPETCAEIAQLENHQVASAIGDFTQSKLVRLGDAQGQPISTQDQTFVIIPVEPSGPRVLLGPRPIGVRSTAKRSKSPRSPKSSSGVGAMVKESSFGDGDWAKSKW